LKASYDVVVIGSGFGGAIAAYRNAEAGKSVAILEQGRRWPKEAFPRTVGQTAGAFWRDQGPRGFLEYRAFKNIDVLQGVGLGGGSLHYFNVNLPAPARVLDKWPRPFSRAMLDVYYDRARERLESRQLSPPAGRALPPRTQAFQAAVRGAGLGEARLAEIAVHTGLDRKNWAGVAQTACVYCGNCMLGCHVNAKNALDVTYIADAERRCGAEVFTLHQVQAIRPAAEKGEGYWVEYRVLEEAGGFGGEGRVYGKKVVVGAGALGTSELLLRCRDQVGSLPKLSPTLGTRFSGNGDMLFGGAIGVKAKVDPAQGPSITAVVDVSTPEHAIHIEDLGYADPLMWMMEGLLPPTGGRLTGALRLAGRYLARALGLRGHDSLISDQLSILMDTSRTNHLLPYLGMGSDAGDGRFRLLDGRLELDWSHRRSRAMFREMERSMKRISTAAGGKYSPSFLWRWPSRKLMTAHPLGGAVIGDSDADSVVNHAGEVWNYPGLYVTDGASLPSALSVNPSLTIAAVAERASHWMLHGRELTA
jgi:cholesterol oxidase